MWVFDGTKSGRRRLDSRKPYQEILGVDPRNPRQTRRVPVARDPHYEVRLSEAALALREINSLRKMTDEERARRVEEIKKAIREGTYRVDSFRVAERILREEEPHLFGPPRIGKPR